MLGPWLALLLLEPPAWAQQAAPAIAVPEINAQAWRMPVDAAVTLWTDDAGGAPDHHMQARLAYTWLRNPLIYRYSIDNGPVQELDVLANAHQANVVGSYAWNGLRVGLDLPVLLAARGALVDAGAGVGDVAFDIKGVILDREGEGAPVGVAAVSRLALPTATVQGAALGSAGPVWELGAVADHQRGPVLVAANLGSRFVRPTALGAVDYRGQAFFRVGAGWSVVEQAGLSADLVGALGYGNPVLNPATTPIELLLGGFGRVADVLVLRGGLGTALTAGVSAPDVRMILAVGLEPPEVRDKDADGITDRADGCPLVAEDIDRHEDTDGCPDPTTVVHLLVHDHLGDVIYTADVGLTTPGGSKFATGDATLDLHPGSYPLTVRVPRYAQHDGTIEVPVADRYEQIVRLAPLFGEVRVIVTGVEGELVQGAARVATGGGGRISGGVARFELDPGTAQILIEADGYQPARASVVVEAGALTELRIPLEQARARVVDDRIEILDKVFFDLGAASIRPESFPLLNEVARVLRENPQLLRISVDGHTDDQGSVKINTKLSLARAESVVAYLVAQGVEPGRLTAQGYGPSRPLVAATTPEAREHNRRVEFVIVEQSLDAP